MLLKHTANSLDSIKADTGNGMVLDDATNTVEAYPKGSTANVNELCTEIVLSGRGL